MAGKVNNDILIPRSILKRNEAGIAKKTAGDNLDDFDELLNDAEQLASKEAVVGKQIDMNGPIVSPRTYN
jgi:predicted secreted acid phosphatase